MTSYHNGRVTVWQGDCRDVLAGFEADSFDSACIDPPYHFASIVKRWSGQGPPPVDGVFRRSTKGFMGKAWDGGQIAHEPETWATVLRVLKPGAHLVAFHAPKNWHRLAIAIEDAGFEIRDNLLWLFGSGFPKSHDLRKGIAKARSEDIAPTRAVCRFIRAGMDAGELVSRDLVEHFGNCNPRLIDHWAARDTDSQPSLPTPEQWEILKTVLHLGDEMDVEVARLNSRKGTRGARWLDAEIVGHIEVAPPGFGDQRFEGDRTIRDLDKEAAAWTGFGTSLKPAYEPIVLARKPLARGNTIAGNVLTYGTGALNIDACRVGVEGGTSGCDAGPSNGILGDGLNGRFGEPVAGLGRWPANIVHDGSPEVVEGFPEPHGAGEAREANRGTDKIGMFGLGNNSMRHGDSGSAARFFAMFPQEPQSRLWYGSKADADDRIGSRHPTVKPLDLIQWLCRLITPKGGHILDCFAGTGTTAEAALREGFQCTLIEREPEYLADIDRRMALALEGSVGRSVAMAKLKPEGEPLPLFAGQRDDDDPIYVCEDCKLSWPISELTRRAEANPDASGCPKCGETLVPLFAEAAE